MEGLSDELSILHVRERGSKVVVRLSSSFIVERCIDLYSGFAKTIG